MKHLSALALILSFILPVLGIVFLFITPVVTYVCFGLSLLLDIILKRPKSLVVIIAAIVAMVFSFIDGWNTFFDTFSLCYLAYGVFDTLRIIFVAICAGTREQR